MSKFFTTITKFLPKFLLRLVTKIVLFLMFNLLHLFGLGAYKIIFPLRLDAYSDLALNWSVIYSIHIGETQSPKPIRLILEWCGDGDLLEIKFQHKRVWTASLLHAMQLPNPLITIQVSNLSKFQTSSKLVEVS